MPQDYEVRTSIYHHIGENDHVRTPVDTIPERRMFVFEYLDETLLRLVSRDLLSSTFLKYVLKCALRGLAVLHERDIVHNSKDLPFVAIHR